MKINMVKLKPCPFCGGKAKYEEYTGEYQNRVFCKSCEAEIWGDYLEDPNTIRKWNNRICGLK